MPLFPKHSPAPNCSDAAENEGKPISRPHIGLRAFIGTFGTNLFIQGCTILQGVIVARLLGPLGRGEYAAVILWPTLFAAVSILGSNISISRLAAKGVEPGSLFRSAFLTGVVTSSLGAVACYFAAPFLMPANEAHLVPLARLFVLFIPLNHIGLNFVAVDLGACNFNLYNFYRSILNPLYVITLTVFWLIGIRIVEAFVIALLSAYLAVALIRFFFVFSRYNIKGRIYPILKIFKQSLLFGLAGMADPFYQQADKAILLWLLGAENLGIYVVALSASTAVNSLTTAAGAVTFTISAQENHREGAERVFRIFRMSVFLWIVFGVMIAALMPWVLPLIYGKEFASGVVPAQLLIIGSAAVGLSSQLEQAMRGQGRAFVGLEGRLAGLVIMAGLGILLSKYFQLQGVCIAFVSGQFFCLGVMLRRCMKHYGVALSSPLLIPSKRDMAIFVKALKASKQKILNRAYSKK